ncbi:hypothetical protein BJX64DRAFT_255706 [Aspergillus heterothallicus]
MSALHVPESGLSLYRDSPGDDLTGKQTQIMRLNLAQNTLDELIESLRADQPARIRLGKTPTLFYGSNKSYHFHSSSEPHRSEIYTSSTNNEKLYFTGVLSHTLEVQKAQEATAATDQALANLEQSLSAFERGKESKKTHIITDIAEVRALRAGDSRSSTGKQAAFLARMPSSKVEMEKDRLLKNKSNSNRSVSSSPMLGVARSPVPVPLTPTSAPLSQNKDRTRLDALKVPFIHLLAIRAVSTKFLARQTRSAPEDCAALAQKYGVENRINPEKFDLRDKVYRELDVWNFPYPSQEDRQEAIENAISAFDRMRISRTDKLWQSLLPKDERGKGKCLSRLDLRTGPIKKALTPRIHVSDETGKEGYATSQETDKSVASLNSSKPGDSANIPKTGMNTQKKRNDKDMSSKRPPAKAKTTTNSTLTGRVTKKSDRKAPSKAESKFKSAEYVHDSDDEDTDPPDVSSSSEKSHPQQAQRKPRASPKPSDSRAPKEHSHAPTPRTDRTDISLPKSDTTSNNKPSATKRPPSSLPTAHRSPQKPSASAASPSVRPTSIHDRSRSSGQNNSSSSSSSSPLITQLSRPRISTERVSVKQPTKPNGVARTNEATSTLKRKAEVDRPPLQNPSRIHGDLDHKRQRAVSTSSGSTGSVSPPLSRELLSQQLRDKSQKFKRFYAKYRSLYDAMAAHSDPPRADVEKLNRQHAQLQRMKKEIWDEHRRLRDD